MPYHLRIAVVGAVAVLGFDAAMAFAARRYGFDYTRGIVGSLLIYLAVGYFAARQGGPLMNAAVAGAIVGFIDASIGWAVSYWIGPGRDPRVQLTPGVWVSTAVFVILLAGGCAAVGGAIGKRLPIASAGAV